MIEGRLRGPSTPSVGGGNVVVEQGLYLGHPLADFPYQLSTIGVATALSYRLLMTEKGVNSGGNRYNPNNDT